MTTAIRITCLAIVLPLLVGAAGVKRISQSEAMEAVVSKVAPEYPQMARQLKLTGTVEVEIVVGENGAVESATPVSGNPVLTKPAADALKKWKFKPFQENGAPAKAQAVLKVSFAN